MASVNTQKPKSEIELDANRIVEALKGRWKGHMAMCHCPAHDDRTPSLCVSIGDKAVLVHCYAGCTNADVLDALGKIRRDPTVGRPASGYRERPSSYFGLAENLWKSGRSLPGTAGEIYLRRRGIRPLPGFARFLPSAVTYDGARKVEFPALILPIANDDGLTGIQRVFLDKDGNKAPLADPKLSLGVRREDGAIRYGGVPAGPDLNLAEGFEDAASAMSLHDLDHCWAVCGIERYGKIAIPQSTRRIRIWSQHGVEAARAISRAEPHLKASGRALEIILPPPGGDWNDALMAMQDAGQSVA